MILDGISGTAPTGTGQAAADGRKLQDDLNRFLNLLVTQLQNQDPLEPLDANEFTTQLVQFASVEQQIYQNANLEKLLGVAQNAQIGAMVSYLGTTVETEGNTLQLDHGLARASYTLRDSARETVLTVRDGFGRTVFSTAGETSAGRYPFEWDGRDSHGTPLADGSYTLEITAKRGDGSLVDASTTTFARVTGAAFENNEVMLFTGNTSAPLSSVLSVLQGTPSADREGEPAG